MKNLATAAIVLALAGTALGAMYITQNCALDHGEPQRTEVRAAAQRVENDRWPAVLQGNQGNDRLS